MKMEVSPETFLQVGPQLAHERAKLGPSLCSLGPWYGLTRMAYIGSHWGEFGLCLSILAWSSWALSARTWTLLNFAGPCWAQVGAMLELPGGHIGSCWGHCGRLLGHALGDDAVLLGLC